MKKIYILLTVLLVLVSSCSEFLGVDEKNPNNASAVPANLILPAAQAATATNVTNPDNYRFVYLWYGCWCISGGYSQDATLSMYNPVNSDYQGNWNNTYLNLQNYDYIEKSVVDAKDYGYKAIAMIMKAYNYEYLVDAYGNVPYTQALKTNEGILKPTYDNQKDIYDSLVLKLDKAITIIDALPSDATEIGDYDVMYHGDMGLWKKFANTLKLRLLVNQSGLTDRATYISEEIAKTGKSKSDFIGHGEGAWVNPGYLQSTDKMNPFWNNFYKQDGSRQSDGLSYTMAGQDACDFLMNNNDPRKFRFFKDNSKGVVKGNYYGQIAALEPVPTTSELGPGLVRSFDMSAPLLTEWESLFLQAEAVQRGILTGDAKALYEEAVTESIIYMGGTNGTAADAAAYLSQTGKPLVNFAISPNKLETILSQKWMSLNGISPMPLWTDYRRTGYPSFLHFSETEGRRSDFPPVRMLYPQSEINVNNDNVVAQGTIDIFTSKIFWQNR